MAALETRLLLLGGVALFEPINGYQLRRELMSWQVDSWANIAPGTIYNGLATLTKRGELTRHTFREGEREVAVYQVTDAGHSEFARLFEQAMTTVTPTFPIAFHTALSLLPLVTRDTAQKLLLVRLERLDELRRQYADAETDVAHVPPHVVALSEFWQRLGNVEYEWLTRLAFRIGDGALEFAGEPPTWEPSSDDPGWQIARDRQRYRRILNHIGARHLP